MGTGNSKEEPKVERPKDIKVILDTKVREQITKLNEYVANFNQGDTEALLKVVDSYSDQLKKYLPNTTVKGIKEYIAKFQTELIQELQKEYPNETQEQIKERMLAKLRDKQLVNYLQNKNDGKMTKLKEEITNNNIVAGNKPAQTNINSIFTNISQMKAKYRYFEYKYVRMNLFMVVFIQHVLTTMNNFVVSIVEYVYREQSEKQKALVSLVKQLLELIEKSDMTISTDDFQRIDDLMGAVESQLKDANKKLDQAVDKAKYQATNEITKLLTAEENLASVDSFKKFETPDMSTATASTGTATTTTTTTTATASPSALGIGSTASASPSAFGIGSTASASPSAFGSTASPGAFTGGFVRDHSRFPQSFYDLT